MNHSPTKKRVVVCGEKWVAERCLDFLYERVDTEICAVIASPTDWQADLISWAVKRKLKVFVGNINHYVEELALQKPDFIFSLQYRPLLKSAILNLPAQKCINLHFGLLPRYGGCYPITWAILNGEKEAGVTIHTMSEKFDEGDIIAQTTVPIGIETTARELFDQASKAAAKLFIDTYPALCHGSLKTHPQDLSQKLYYTKDSINFERDRIIDWQQPRADIQRRICGFSFKPFQAPVTHIQLPDGRRLAVDVAHTRPYSNGRQHLTGQIGDVVKITASGSVIVTTRDQELLEIGLLNNKPSKDFIESLGCSLQEIKFV